MVADESNRQLARNHLCRCWPGGEHVQQLFAFLFAVLLDLETHHGFCAGLMPVGIENEAAAKLRALNGPAGEHLGGLNHVSLRVAAIYTHRVTFHQLAAILLVDSSSILSLAVGPAPGGHLIALG